MSILTFSLTNGGTAEQMTGADADRTALILQPQTENTLVQFGQTAGLQATGALTVAVNPSNNETIVINGVTFTFVTGASTTTNVHIGADAAATAVNLAAVLNASVNAAIILATYSAASGVVTVTAVAGGTDGNAYTLADSSGGNVTRSAATLAGGSNTVGGLLLLAAEPPVVLTLAECPDIQKAVYVVSPTNAAYTNYYSGTWKAGR